MALLTPTSKAEVTISCEASLIFELLTDYDSYEEWIPMVTKAKLLAKEGDLALAEIEVSQPAPDKMVLECIHDKNRSVLARAISGATPLAKIEWTIAPSGPGQCLVTVALEGKVDWHWLVPGYRKLLDARQYARALEGQAAAFTSQISVAGDSGELILDLMETSEGMVLVYRGKKYLLQPVGEEPK
jgi:ribosome-associated toxin RatA of RatAB toxin-antitoxin module